MKQNRFAPPVADVTEPEAAADSNYELASRSQRATGCCIDLLITYPMTLILQILPSLLGIFDLLDIRFSLLDIPTLLVWPVSLFCYYMISEITWHRTIGKLVTGTSVIHVSGSRPTSQQVLIRTLVRFIPFEFLTFLNQQPQPAGWHDQWSGTRVILSGRDCE